VNEELVPTINWAVKMTYGPLHRTAWALVLGWIIVACIHGYGGEKPLKMNKQILIYNGLDKNS
jgi:hypothetical protein